MTTWLPKFIVKVFVVIGALLLLQAPLFMQECRQQLSGHVLELRLQVNNMKQAASGSGKTLDEFIEKFRRNGDSDFARQGEVMHQMVSRFQSLSKALSSLDQSNVFTRPFVFLWHFNYDIASATFGAFALGIPLTFEAVVYCLVGIFIGYGIFVLLAKLFRKLSFRN
jgi:hypothetical protein